MLAQLTIIGCDSVMAMVVKPKGVADWSLWQDVGDEAVEVIRLAKWTKIVIITITIN